MTFTQVVMPNPDIPCEPGWCLQYVRQAFGAPVVEPTATAGWFNAKKRHTDWDFPENCWVPVWFELDNEPAGHVALLAPDGSVYSTTMPNTYWPTKHPNLQDLFNAYAPYNPLTYRGWSEDISGVTVVQEMTIRVESMDDMPSAQEVAQATFDMLMNTPIPRQGGSMGGEMNLRAYLAWSDANNEIMHRENAQLRAIVEQLAVKQGVTIDYAAIAKAVNDDAAARMQK